MVCNQERVEVLIDAGAQPLCNRFMKMKDESDYKFPLVFGQCHSCGVLQLVKKVPPEEIAPRFDWLVYKEPEEHLDYLADLIYELPGIGKDSRICGISSKDSSLLRRFSQRGISFTWVVNPKEDLRIATPGAGSELIQEYLNEDKAKEIVGKNKKSDVVIARHIYEHSADIQRLAGALKKLVADHGYIVIEIPDCTKALEENDYTMLWEEHMTYFTPDTFKQSLDILGFSIIHYESFEYPTENALVAILKVKNSQSNINADFKKDFALAKKYSEGFAKHKSLVHNYLSTEKKQGKKIAMFGAGHLACTYINLMDIGSLLSFVIDDNPNKRGLFMPGSSLEVCGSAKLENDKVDVCLLSLRPDIEHKILSKNKQFIDKGGQFISIYSSSSLKTLN